MTVTLDSTFEIANGQDRLAQVLADDSGSLSQETQTAVRGRAEWVTAFHSRAVRQIPLVYVVTFPACESEEAAFLQARTIPAQCPRGGVLVEQMGATLITYEDAWINGAITWQRTGVRNVFTFPLMAINPDVVTLELSPLAAMDSRYIANFHHHAGIHITGLTGGGEHDLDSLVTADVGLGFAAHMWVTVDGVVMPKVMTLVAGDDATNTDPGAGRMVVRPLDFDEDTNAKIWVE